MQQNRQRQEVVMMARAPDKRIEQAKEMYLQGQKLVEIASQLNLPEGTVRRWKCTHKWENERSGNKSERSQKRKRGAQPGNKNSHGGPPGNKRRRSMDSSPSTCPMKPGRFLMPLRMLTRWTFCGIRSRLRMQPSSGRSGLLM